MHRMGRCRVVHCQHTYSHRHALRCLLHGEFTEFFTHGSVCKWIVERASSSFRLVSCRFQITRCRGLACYASIQSPVMQLSDILWFAAELWHVSVAVRAVVGAAQSHFRARADSNHARRIRSRYWINQKQGERIKYALYH